MDFKIHVEKNENPDCLIISFHGSPESFDQIKRIPGYLGEVHSITGSKCNFILDFSRLDISIEYLRYFFEQLKRSIEEHATEWCSVSHQSIRHYVQKGLHHVMKNEKPVFSSVDEAKSWISEICYK